MAVPNKKIRLTFLWADESVMFEDFRKKNSKKMVEWANDFYGQYGFELDVSPAPTLSPIALAHKFCLRKSDGIKPDPDFDLEELYIEKAREIAPFEKEIEDFRNEIQNLNDESGAKYEVILANREKYNLLDEAYAVETDSHAKHVIRMQQDKLHDKIMLLYDQNSAINDQIIAIKAKIDSVEDKIKEKEKKYDLLEENADSEIPLRIALGLKFLNEKIVTEDRLCIVFCKFISRRLEMRKIKGKTLGYTIDPDDSIAVATYFLWTQPFIVIDIGIERPSVLAHEIIHATGRYHPLPFKVIKNMEKYLNFKPERAVGSALNMASILFKNHLKFASLFKQVSGGLYDGPPNSLLNYNSQRFLPSEVVLPARDKTLLENATFVMLRLDKNGHPLP